MDNQKEEILQKIEEAEYVLVGLGQEFDMEFFLQSREDYRRIREQLQQAECTLALAICGSTVSKAIYAGDGSRDRKGIAEAKQKYWKKELFCGFHHS